MTEKIARRRPGTEQRRKDLVQIAYRLIAEKGLEGLRTRQVAEAAGIDTGTLHYHFPSKQALIQAVVDHLAEDFRTNRAARATAPANALEELRNEIFDVVARVRESPEQLVVTLELTVRASRDRAVAKILARMQQGWTDSLTEFLKRGIEQGLFRADIQPKAAAFVLRAQVEGVALLGMAVPERVEAVASALFMQMKAWLSKPEPTSATPPAPPQL
jgi:AcrR family transcriptional regulator